MNYKSQINYGLQFTDQSIKDYTLQKRQESLHQSITDLTAMVVAATKLAPRAGGGEGGLGRNRRLAAGEAGSSRCWAEGGWIRWRAGSWPTNPAAPRPAAAAPCIPTAAAPCAMGGRERGCSMRYGRGRERGGTKRHGREGEGLVGVGRGREKRGRDESSERRRQGE